MQEINVYCDESCHLEHDDSPTMVIGAIYCPKNKLKEINKRIKEIKAKHGVNANSEIKWTKVSHLKSLLYLDIIDYFFDDDDLSFRCIVADKTNLNHERFNQTHDDWYYKIYFSMLQVIFDPEHEYNVYIDIKDTHTHEKALKLRDICRNSKLDFSGKIIKKIQPIRSEEVQIMQIVDILSGAIGYANRYNFSSNDSAGEKNAGTNLGKAKVIQRIRQRSGYTLKRSTLLRENKINIFKWEGR